MKIHRRHRDDDTEKGSTFKKGNFKELLNFRVDAKDKVLEEHLAKCAKNASYTSKTSQNQLLLCMKKYIQNKMVVEVKKPNNRSVLRNTMQRGDRFKQLGTTWYCT